MLRGECCEEQLPVWCSVAPKITSVADGASKYCTRIIALFAFVVVQG